MPPFPPLRLKFGKYTGGSSELFVREIEKLRPLLDAAIRYHSPGDKPFGLTQLPSGRYPDLGR